MEPEPPGKRPNPIQPVNSNGRSTGERKVVADGVDALQAGQRLLQRNALQGAGGLGHRLDGRRRVENGVFPAQAEEEFGLERIKAQLRSSALIRNDVPANSTTAESILFSMLGTVQDFAASHPLVDDLSLVVIRRDH